MIRESKDPEDGRGGKNGIEGKLLAMARVQPANSRDACGNYIRSVRHPEKKTSPTSSPKKKFVRRCLNGDIFLRMSFIINEKFVGLTAVH